MKLQVSTTETQGNLKGIVLELDNGHLLCGGLSGFAGIRKSTDGGATWVDKYSYTNGSMTTRMHFIASNGNIFFGGSRSVDYAPMIRSTDNGETFQVVMTAESSALWFMVEASNGDLYASEYSSGNQDEEEHYGYNVWKSTDDGATWSIFYTAPKQSSPGADDGIRHLHILAIDSDDQLYLSFGDRTGGYAGSGGTYKLNPDGTLGTEIFPTQHPFGNGNTGFVEADNGSLYFGSDDTNPTNIFRYDRDTDVISVVANITEDWGAEYEWAILDMCKGHDGVLYALTNGRVSLNRPPALVASADDGSTWVLVRFTEEIITSTHISCNTVSGNKKIYMDKGTSDNFVSLTDYSRQELKDLYTSNVSFNGTITVL